MNQMSRTGLISIFFVGAILVCSPCWGSELEPGSSMPSVLGKTLSGEEINLPSHLKGKTALLVLSFTKASGKLARPWAEAFSKDHPTNDQTGMMQLIFLESVPRLLRGIVSSSIKKGIPKNLHEQTALIYKDETKWKQSVGFKEKDDAPFLILVDQEGRIQWFHHGVFEQQSYAALAEHVDRLLQLTINNGN